MINWGNVSNVFRPAPISIIGVDPGTDTLGSAILTFDPVSFAITNTQARTFIASRELDAQWIDEFIGFRESRLRHLEYTLYHLFCSIEPFLVVAESNFMRVTMPMAYGALVESVSSIRRALYQYNPTKVLYLIDPNKAKHSVGVVKEDYSRKEAVRESLLKLPLNYLGNIPLNRLDSHSSDAIAIAYTKYLEIREASLIEKQLRSNYYLS